MVFLNAAGALLVAFFLFFGCIAVGLSFGGDPGGMLGMIIGMCCVAGWGAQCGKWMFEEL